MKKQCLFIIVLMVCSTVNTLYCQPTTPPALPAMHVDKNIGNERILRFSQAENSKYAILKKESHQDLFFIYTKDAVNKLMATINTANGIRIYFARYKECNITPWPLGVDDDKIIVLFATEPAAGTVPDKYYFLNEKDKSYYDVPKECGEAWIKDYEENVLPKLLTTLVPTADDEHPVKSGKYSDTRSIYFTSKMIKEAFVDEPGYRHETRLPGKESDTTLTIDAYKVSFSAYGANGNGGSGKNIYKNRLFIQFDYMYRYGGTYEVFYLDDMNDFASRPKPGQQQKSLRKPAKKVNKKPGKTESVNALNNGQLCPTNCPK